jgi:hypothetical protein
MRMDQILAGTRLEATMIRCSGIQDEVLVQCLAAADPRRDLANERYVQPLFAEGSFTP